MTVPSHPLLFTLENFEPREELCNCVMNNEYSYILNLDLSIGKILPHQCYVFFLSNRHTHPHTHTHCTGDLRYACWGRGGRKTSPWVVSSWDEEDAKLHVPPKQRMPSQYSVGPSVSVELKRWVERSDRVSGARFTGVRAMRGRNGGMEREDFDASCHGLV